MTWEIDSDDAAQWALRRLAAARQEIQRVNDAGQNEIDRIEFWMAEHRKGPQRDVAFFENRLMEWHRQNAEVFGKTRVYPSGTLKRSDITPKPVVANEPSFVRWATDSGHLELLKIEPRKAEIKKFAKVADDKVVDPSTGEVIPGLGASDAFILSTVSTESGEQPAWLPTPEGVVEPSHEDYDS